MTDIAPLPPPDPPIGFTYDGSSDALAKVEHLVGRSRMRMAERVETRTQFNWRTQSKQTASVPYPDPLTLEIAVAHSDESLVWLYVPIGSRIEHTVGEHAYLMVDLGEPERPLMVGTLRDGTHAAPQWIEEGPEVRYEDDYAIEGVEDGGF